MKQSRELPNTFILISLSAFVLVLLLAGCRQESDTWERIQTSGILTVGLDPTFPPFEVATDNTLEGFDVELAKEVAGILGLESSFLYFGYDGLYDALATEKVDLLISALVVDPGRMEDFAYTNGYINAGQVIVYSAERDGLDSDHLSGTSLAVELGSEGHLIADELRREQEGLDVQAYNSAREALDSVRQGHSDGAITDFVTARLYKTENQADDLDMYYVTVETFAMVVRIEDEKLLARLNQAIEELQTSSEIKRLTDRWLGD